MKKNTLLVAIGQKPKDDLDEEEVTESEDSSDTEDDTSAEDDAIDTFIDDKEDPETRRAAFRQAVKLCMKNY